jgi:quinolinate synthase
MKKINLGLVFDALEKEQFTVKVPEDIRVRTKRALDRMLNVD